jgi:CheY-like chemotaxis protein
LLSFRILEQATSVKNEQGQSVSSLTVVTHTQANSDEEADMSKTVFESNSDALSVERRKHILCADDHEDTRYMMARLLDLYGYEVTTAGSLAEALPLTEKGGFDLLILDGWYGDGLGVDLCKQIRAFDAHTPIVFLSGYAYQSDIDKGMAAGAQAYLTKPLDLDVLEQTIAGLMISQRDSQGLMHLV